MRFLKKLLLLFCCVVFLGQSCDCMKRKRSRSYTYFKKHLSPQPRRMTPVPYRRAGSRNCLSPLSYDAPQLLIRSLSRENSFESDPTVLYEPVRPAKKKRVKKRMRNGAEPHRMEMIDVGVQVRTCCDENEKHDVMQREFLSRHQSFDFHIDADFNFTTVNGISLMFDLRGFTAFCNDCDRKEISWAPAVFTKLLFNKLSAVVKKREGHIISITGDGFLAVFPKKRRDKKYAKVSAQAMLCSLEIINEVKKFRCELVGNTSHVKLIVDGPKRCGIGLQIGPNHFFNIKRHDSRVFDMVSDVSNTVNVSQRYENFSKTITKDLGVYMPLVIPAKIFTLLPKHLKKIFTQHRLVKLRGVEEPVILHAGPFSKIKHFYFKNPKIFNKKMKRK